MAKAPKLERVFISQAKARGVNTCLLPCPRRHNFRDTYGSLTDHKHQRHLVLLSVGDFCPPKPVSPLTYPRTGFKTFAKSEEHTSELQSRPHLVCRLLL